MICKKLRKRKALKARIKARKRKRAETLRNTPAYDWDTISEDIELVLVPKENENKLK